MQKKALTVNAYVVAAGAFGAFFRWLQNQTAFEPDTGLLKPGIINYIVPLLIIAALYLFYRIVKGIKAQGLTPPDNVWHAFRAKHIAYPAVYYVTALVTALYPGGAKEETVKTDIPVAETVIVGEVPEAYLR